MKKINYIVQGMRCASCKASVNNEILKIKGVINSNTNLLTGLVEVEANDNFDINLPIIAINSLGFKGYIKNDSKLNINIDKYFNLFELIILLIFGFIILYTSMINMLIDDPSKYIFSFLNHKVNPIGFSTTLLVFSIPVIIIGLKFFVPGIKGLIKLHPNMDSLITIGSVTAFIYSLVYTILIYVDLSNSHMYCMNLLYESSTTVIALIYLGKYIEQISTNKAKKSINDLVNLIPINAMILNKENKLEEVCVNALNVDDIVFVKAGEKVPVDGIVVKNTASLDTHLITGESDPIIVKENDTVLAGSMLLDNSLYIKASKISSDTTLNNILALVSKANIKKSKITNLIDKISFYFVPIVILVSIITLIIWLILDINLALTMFINTLVIACPCSIGLAIPLANVIASIKALKNGIVYKNYDAHSKINKINYVIFDKTGTLTNGKFSIEIMSKDDSYSINEIYSIIGSLEENNNHPIGKSINKFILENKIEYISNIQKKDIQSVGIVGIIKNIEYKFANYKLLNENCNNINKEYLYLLSNDKVIATILLKDELNKGSKKLINYLNNKNINVMMLTGDNEEKALRTAKELNINNYLSELLPSDKYNIIEELKENKENNIMYIGDGINDAPSLNLADISITPYQSSDIANESSDIYLLNDDLSLIINIFKLSKYTYKIMILNIIWSFLYNIIAMLFASGVFYSLGILLEPYISALSMALSSICVVFTSLTINFAFKNKRK